MAPSRKRGARAAAAAAAARQQWKVGDLVLAKMKGFPAWPAIVSEPEKWGFSSDRKKLLVYFYGTKQIAFCNYADIEAFTEEKKKSLLVKRQGKGADFVRAVEEIIDIFEKRQDHTEFNSRDEGIDSNTGNCEVPRSKSSKKISESHLHVTNNSQAKELRASTNNNDAINHDEVPWTSTEGDFHDDPDEKVSILDQLRQTPLSTTTTRRRQRDGSHQTSVVQRVPSLRRSRSSSGRDPYKCLESSKTGSGADQGSDNVSDVLHEESALKKRLTGDVAECSLCCSGDIPVSASLPSNGSTEEGIVSDVAAMRSDAEEGSMSESSCKYEKSDEYLDKDQGLNGGVTLNGKLELPIKTMIFKKKRKPNRKRVTSIESGAAADKEAEVQAELRESLSSSPNSSKEVVENASKADGDEHLPLVKRARVRMGKPPAEESQLDIFVEKQELLEVEEHMEGSDKNTKPTSPITTCPSDWSSIGDKERSNSSLPNGCTLSAGRDSMFWNVKKGIAVDHEAALPPSKRLHRALEAMKSANAAEAREDMPEASSGMEVIPRGCTDSLDDTIRCPTRSPCLQSSDSIAFHNTASKLPSSLAFHEVVPDDSLTQNLRSHGNNDCKKTLVDAQEFDALFTSQNAAVDTHENVKSVEKQMISGDRGVLNETLPLGGLSMNNTLTSSKERSYSRKDVGNESNIVESNLQKSDPVLNYKEGGDFLPSNGTAAVAATTIVPTASKTSGSVKPPISLSDECLQARDMPDVAQEVKSKLTPKDWDSSDTTPIKDLIAAAQAKAKRPPSRSTSFPHYVVDEKFFGDNVVSPSEINRGDSSLLGSPQNSLINHRPATDDRTHHLQNGSRSPFVGQKEKGINKLSSVESNIARRSFESLLCTLSRTKESIGRATRVAMDCGKCGVAGEVIETLLRHLERESSLHKRIDLFFLVDSITQCSRSQKGGVGDVYLSLVQSVLPRLLSAAAPHGNSAWENRKQCLKVLRLWLERKTLSESVVRHHIRELESVTELASSYSRRLPRTERTERSINDPIREMEGMFVDEYGSNTSFQLQNFIHPRLLEDDEGSGDEGKSFEAVTPERKTEVEAVKEPTQISNEKHRHILEDVDGELEMEDVAPPCGVEVRSGCHVEQHQSLLFAPPPLPQDLPPSPPPLPSSPPPTVPSCCSSQSSVPQQQLIRSHAHTDLPGTNNFENLQPQPITQPPNNFQGSSISSESMHYYTHGYGGFPKQIPPPPPSLCSSDPYGPPHSSILSGNDFLHNVNAPLPNKAYHLQPPPPSVSNQFSYIQAGPQQRQSWGSSLFGDRYQNARDPQGGNHFADGNTMGPIQHENSEIGRFSSAINTGPLSSDKAGNLPNSLSCYGPPSEPSSNPCHGWSIPPRVSSYSVSASRPSIENPNSRASGGYWRPR